MQKSVIAKNGGDGNVNEVKLRDLKEQWGSLPPAERAKALQDLTQGLSPTDRAIIEAYFRSLTQSSKR